MKAAFSWQDKNGGMTMNKEHFELTIEGLGIIFYSPHAVRHIEVDEKYLMEHYNDPADVLKHIYEGSLVGFCTGTPGTFLLDIYQDTEPKLEELDPDCALKLCLEVTENTVYFRDLYTLLYWQPEDDTDIKVHMDNGYYEVIACTWMPESGIRGDDQRIALYFNKTDSLPSLRYNGVPQLI